MNRTFSNDVIVALDFKNLEETLAFLAPFRGHDQLYLKVGMELYLQNGPQVLSVLKERGHRIFLDLKLHDIPNTVYGASKGLAQFKVDMLNFHAAGGKEMLEAAKQGLLDGGSPETLAIAVTQLTSTSQEQMQAEQLIPVDLVTSVRHYAQLTQEAGLDGVVASVHEAPVIREVCGQQFAIVTPGIRLAGGPSQDQKRIATPEVARQLGSSHIVVGRPITLASDPVSAYEAICQSFLK